MKQNKLIKKIKINKLFIAIFLLYLFSLLLSILLSYFLNDWAIIYAYLFSLPFFLITFLLAVLLKSNKFSLKLKNRFYLIYTIYFIGKNLLFFLPFIFIYIINLNNYTFLSVWGSLIGVIIQQIVNLSYLFYNKKNDVTTEILSEPM